jgi:coenzyme Q-binding protein COQ10
MAEVTRTIEIDAPLEKVFAAITDFENYPKFLGQLGMTGVEVTSSRPGEKTVRHAVRKMGSTINYTLRYRLEPPHQVSWSFVEGQFMKDNHGSWRLEKVDDSHTRATYTVEVKFGLLVPGSLVNALISNELPQLMEAFKKRAEEA